MNAKDDAENTSATFTITLKVANPDKNIESLANNLQITANFAKYDEMAAGTQDTTTTTGLIYTLNDDKVSWSVKGDWWIDEDWNVVGNVPDNVQIAPFVQGLPFTQIADGADDVFANLSKEKVMSFADELVTSGLDITGKVAGLRNKVNAADLNLKSGKTLFGKL